ncbi:hypothetical protein GBA52_008495 [Prunus armeniaca]|nr:hypothetical protein GBA52_008495 [Prunus armeniaca]
MRTRVEVLEMFLVELMVKVDPLHSNFDQLRKDFLDEVDTTIHTLPNDDFGDRCRDAPSRILDFLDEVDSTVHRFPDDDIDDRRRDAPSRILPISKFDQLRKDVLHKADSTAHPLPDDDVSDRRRDALSRILVSELA